MQLGRRTILKMLSFMLECGIAIFPTFDLSFTPGMPYWALICASVGLITFYLWRYDRPLLARRMTGGAKHEKEPTQRKILHIAAIVFILPVIVPGLVYQWHPWPVPAPVMLAGYGFVIAGLLLVFLALRANSFAGATVQVFDGHRVIEDGLYAHMRHPMYTGLLLVFAGTSPALGSYWGLLALPLIVAVMIWRLSDEEKILREKLPGYAAYCGKVRARLVPFIY
jgi:protein-S-isoprenylcysteine O-methyltransferase Ste14